MKSKSNKSIAAAGPSEETDVSGHAEPDPVTRGLFLRSLGLGALALGLQKVGYSKNGLFPEFEKLSRNSTPSGFSNLKHYYAHDAVTDSYGVIAPWYDQQNGQCDFRIRIAAETMKRYPWTTTKNAIVSYPDYLFTSNWEIAQDGKITPKHFGDWSNGDLGQRAVCALAGMTDYYRYSGDPAAIAHLTYMGDYVLDYGLTPADHPWPNFPVSVPVKGKAYGKADPKGWIQLDISAAMGETLLRAYQVTKKERWLDAAKHWGDLLVSRCDTHTGGPPWPRYANPEAVLWQDNPRINLQTGSVVLILNFLEELIRMGYTGKNGEIPVAREAGIRYLRDRLLPEWLLEKTWGCYFWDWIHDKQESHITANVASYLITHKDDFPNWRNDARNILLLFIHRTTVDRKSGADVYNGAWAYPESSMCCGRSLWYAPLGIGTILLKYGIIAEDALMRELGYRQIVLQTYDAHETGVSEDNIDGGVVVNNEWLAIAVPLPLQFVQQAVGWLPEELGASRENHLVRGTAVVDSIVYGKGVISYSTFNSPAETIEVFRLSYVPSKVSAEGQKLPVLSELTSNGYTIKKLPNGDAIVTIRHDGLKKVVIQGPDPQSVLKNGDLHYDGEWTVEKDDSSRSGTLRVAENRHASATAEFYGNQFRLTGRVDGFGGQADVFVDGVQQLVFIDCWNPSPRAQQILYYKNGLEQGKHILKIVVRGAANPYAQGSKVYIDSILFSSASGKYNFTSGTGPAAAQRMIFGYPKREDYKDSNGNLWRPALEVVAPLLKGKDAVAGCWLKETKNSIEDTPDPELYRFGFRASDFWVNVTVGPGKYGVRLKFASTQEEVEYMKGFDIIINENTVVKNFNMPGTAKKMNTAVDLVFENIVPKDGVIQVRFKGNAAENADAFVQALEVDQQLKGKGVTPVLYKETK